MFVGPGKRTSIHEEEFVCIPTDSNSSSSGIVISIALIIDLNYCFHSEAHGIYTTY